MFNYDKLPDCFSPAKKYIFFVRGTSKAVSRFAGRVGHLSETRKGPLCSLLPRFEDFQ